MCLLMVCGMRDAILLQAVTCGCMRLIRCIPGQSMHPLGDIERVYTYVCVCAPEVYGMHFADANGRPYLSSGGRVSKGAPILVGCTDEIEELRPKSPPPGGDRN